MPVRGGKITTAVAAVLLVLTAGCADGGSGGSDAKAEAPAPATPKAPADLKDLLTNPHEDQSKDEVLTFDFKQVAEKSLLAPPKGMAFTPDSCVNYVTIGDAASTPLQTAPAASIAGLNGYMQFNTASPVGKDHNLGHDNFFAQFVVELPEGPKLEAMHKAATACAKGDITLDGKVPGTLSNVDFQTPPLAGAETKGLIQRITFPPQKDKAGTDVLKTFYGAVGPDGGIDRFKHIVMVVMGNVLYYGIVTDPATANKMAANFHRLATARGLS
ncbi:hypothetical protein F8271_04715 [Micromonospora sp. ALFpr18c]|uniref:hypothetical protein n=1 Tax=unclassified Micromonospora TaxID=2617518 RepID=UPI00124BC7E1|nr:MULTISPECIES: hypothetical protein [unclassified Micromonospora]KAB1947293.1 hypothetical protein F8271_04715 [Micromonospora sp. ALFpr18c]MDG4758531.1 hypothetical protein [Micromonospora sp. WMMD710]